MNISWKAPEYMHTEKSADWYWITGIVSLTLAGISILLGNLVFGILIIVGVFTLVLYSVRKPGVVHVEILPTAVRVNDTLYPYVNLESFWVEEKELAPRILFKTRKKVAPYVVILIGDASAHDIREELLLHLPEIKHSEPFLEKLLVYFGF